MIALLLVRRRAVKISSGPLRKKKSRKVLRLVHFDPFFFFFHFAAIDVVAA